MSRITFLRGPKNAAKTSAQALCFFRFLIDSIGFDHNQEYGALPSHTVISVNIGLGGILGLIPVWCAWEALQ